MTKEQEYIATLHKLEITQKLLMSTVQDLDSVRNKKNRTEYDEEMLNWILYIRMSIENEREMLEDRRYDLWKDLEKTN